MPDPSSSASAAAGRRLAGPPVGGTGTGLAEAEAIALPGGVIEKTSYPQPGATWGLHPEADALPLAEAELPPLCAEATEANISVPIVDSATNRSSLFTISPSVASHPIAMLGTRLASVKERPYSPKCVEG